GRGRTERDGRKNGRFRGTRDGMHCAVQPPVFSFFQTRRARFYEVLRVEVRARGMRRAHGMNNRKMSLVPNRLQGSHGRMQSEEAVEIKHAGAWDIDGRAHGV